MKITKLVFAFLLFAGHSAFAALSAATAWEVRTTGSDTNGGGFVAGASGTDWSQQNAAQYSVTDGVTAGTTTITSATASFGTDVVGNIIFVSGGTGSITAGWYQITTRNSATSITVDRSTGLTTGTGVTLHIGGALASPTPLFANYVGGNKAFIKVGTYQTSLGWAPATGGQPSGEPALALMGYNSARGDAPTGANRPVFQLITNTGKTLLNLNTNSSFIVQDIIFDCNSLGTSTGLTYGGFAQCIVSGCTFKNFTTAGVSDTYGYIFMEDSEITAGTSAATAGAVTIAGMVRCWVHDNACPGATFAGFGSVMWSVFSNNTGASSDGVRGANGGALQVFNCVFHANGRHGVYLPQFHVRPQFIQDSIFTSNGGYGIANDTQVMAAQRWFDGNAFYNNTSGTRQGLDDTSGINAVSPYTNVKDIILTGLPYTNAGSNDYSINNVAGQGAAIRAKGLPGALPGMTPVGALDMGVYQHADPVNTGCACAFVH